MSHLLDLATRRFWRLTGRRVDLAGAESWLRAPVSLSPTVADGWPATEAAFHGGTVDDDDPRAGLLPAVAALDGPGFSAAALRPEIRDFYEHTASWRMDVWAGWSPLFWPAGELVARLFGRRVEQLALPMRPLDVAHGMDSRITVIRDRAGAQVSAAWLRTLRSTGRYVFSGCYSVRALPGADRPSVHVAFPLEAGNVQVFLRPAVGANGSLVLESPRGRFGQDGAYVVVHDGGRDVATRLPLHETFRMYTDSRQVLRTDHELRLWDAWAMRLHYRLEPPR
ncbi:hypothetical protein [Myceligenerans xiligouense]|uniref:YndJ-like protein n=1 Tax=Myceligenerans xiligouense TaxID=253184 RepID=A0A3N4Z5V7_9MICO|nr:hypothetical protein [Myceligenerans xiligouense]RPF21228.1 hypothetical protein EDD34_1851 [Myceligenerans xiligouense]